MKTPQLRTCFLSAFLLSIILFAVSCTKVDTTTVVTIPLVATPSILVNVTSTTAQSGGIITSAGGGTILTNGVCYSSTNSTPTTADSKTSDAVSTAGTATTTFTSNLTGLTANTVYYVRAYATNSAGIGYGSVKKFTTSANLSAVVATVTTFVGNATAGFANGTGQSALFNNPEGVTADAQGNIFVCDSYNSVIREITTVGVVTTFAGNGTNGYADGPAATAEFYAPKSAAFDTQGNLYVADFGNNVIRKITPAGVVSTFAGNGTAGYLDGPNTLHAQFNGPAGIAIDAQNNIYIAEINNNLIRKITAAGVVSTIAGIPTAPSAGYVDNTGALAAFNSPNSLAVDASGNIYVADQGNSAIRKVTPAGVTTTLAGNPTQPTLVNLPAGLTIDKAGNLYIADESGRIMEFTTTNTLNLLAGSINVAGFVDGAGTAAQFSKPQGITVDASGNIYVADQNNNCIRKIVISLVP